MNENESMIVTVFSEENLLKAPIKISEGHLLVELKVKQKRNLENLIHLRKIKRNMDPDKDIFLSYSFVSFDEKTTFHISLDMEMSLISKDFSKVLKDSYNSFYQLQPEGYYSIQTILILWSEGYYGRGGHAEPGITWENDGTSLDNSLATKILAVYQGL